MTVCIIVEDEITKFQKIAVVQDKDMTETPESFTKTKSVNRERDKSKTNNPLTAIHSGPVRVPSLPPKQISPGCSGAHL